MSRLSLVSLLFGLGVAALPAYGLARPAAFSSSLKNFSRSEPIGYVLMLLATLWFLWNVSQESIADFASYKSVLMSVFAGIGVGSCIFVRDFISVRGLAVVLLLLAKLMVDTGRPLLSSNRWVLIIQGLAYVLVIFGIWLTISPWRLRDWSNWCAEDPKRLKLTCGVTLGVGLFVAGLGIAKF